MLLGLVFAGGAQARWSSPRVVSLASSPRAVGVESSGGLSLWTGIKRPELFRWPPDGDLIQGAALPAFVTRDTQQPWAVNARGDAVLVAGDGRDVRALVIDATGGRAVLRERVPRTREVERVVADIGDDGTAAVAWTQVRPRVDEELPTVWVRLRPPGGQFQPAIAIPAGGEARAVDLDVRPDGSVSLVHAAWDSGAGLNRLYYRGLRVGEPVPPPQLFATTEDSPETFAIVADHDGRDRVLFDADYTQTGQQPKLGLLTSLRQLDGTWAPPQQLSPDAISDRRSIVELADGTVLAAYQQRGNILVRRALAGEPFGSPEHVASVPPGWWVYSPTLAANARGDILMAWDESSQEEVNRTAICGFSCHHRVLAAVAERAGSFGPPELVSALGTVTDEETVDDNPVLVAGIANTGQRLIAWRAGSRGIHPAGAVVAARGDATPTPTPAPDHRRPSLIASVNARELRQAARGAPLRLRVRTNEPCAVAYGIYPTTNLDSYIDDPPMIVLRHAGTTTARWRLPRADQLDLRRMLRAGKVKMPVVATDRAGNLRLTHIQVIDPGH
jgi:hypothetical protein